MAPSASPQLEETVLIAIDDIDDTDRLRPTDPLVVQGIAASMAKSGQLQAIDICRLINQKSGKPYRLVFGGHRMGAARINGWTHIKAVIRSADALERKEREIAENFFKADLAPLDRAKFIDELMKLEKARQGIADDQDGRANNARGGSQTASKNAEKKQLHDDLCTMHRSMGLQEAVAAKLGLSQATVSRQLPLAAMSQGVVDRVRKLPIAENGGALLKLAKQHSSRQHLLLDLMEDGRAKDFATAVDVLKRMDAKKGLTVDGALAMIREAKAEGPEKKRQGAFIGAFDRMGVAERKAALRELVRQMTIAEKDLVITLASAEFAEAAE